MVILIVLEDCPLREASSEAMAQFHIDGTPLKHTDQASLRHGKTNINLMRHRIRVADPSILVNKRKVSGALLRRQNS